MTENKSAIDFLKLMREERRRARHERTSKALAQNSRDELEAHFISDRGTCEPTSGCNDSQDWPQWSLDLLEPCFGWTRLDPCAHRLTDLDTIFYIPKFLSESVQINLLEWFRALPENTGNAPQGKWNTMKYGKRRVALFERGALPPPLRQLSTVLVHMSIFPVDKEPNHVLVNEYQPGQGIMPHTDGSAYYERTATLSIGGSGVLLNFVPRLESQQIGFQQVETAAQVLLDGNGSLVIFADDAYSKYTHGIEDSITEEVATSKCANADRGTIVRRGYRISLTFRHHYY